MKVRKAVPSDAEICLKIYNSVCDWETENTILTAWNKQLYPTMETVSSALARNDLYVLEDKTGTEKNKIVACGIINQLQPDFYKEFIWTAPAVAKEVLILHTFAVNPDFWGKGYAQFFMNFYETLALQKNCKALRLDTTLTNIPAQNLYKKLGFKLCGQFEDDPNGVGQPLIFLGLEKKV